MTERLPVAGVLLGIALADDAVAVAVNGHRPGDSFAADAAVAADPAENGLRDGLLGLIESLLDGCGLRRRDISGVVFEAGPGGFSRVRAGCAVAQGLGWGLDIPVGAVDSHFLRALCLSPGAGSGGDLRVIIVRDARMGHRFVSVHECRAGQWSATLPVRSIPTDEVAAALSLLPEPGSAIQVIATGDAIDELIASDREFGSWRRTAAADPVDQAVTLVTRAAGYATWGPARDARPLYLRDKIALDLDEQAALRASRTLAQ